MWRGDIKVKIGMITVSVGIRRSSMKAKKLQKMACLTDLPIYDRILISKYLVVIVFVRVFLCSHEEHVLQEMSQSWNLPRIAQVAHMNI